MREPESNGREQAYETRVVANNHLALKLVHQPGIEPGQPALQAGALPAELPMQRLERTTGVEPA
jgi:hypothetical protein